jgi:hypothetical protein
MIENINTSAKERIGNCELIKHTPQIDKELS